MLLLRFKPLRMHYIAIVGIFWWIASLSITLGNGEQNTPFTRTGEIEGCNFWDSPFTADGTRIITSKVDEVRVWDTGSLKPTTKWLHHGKVLWMQLSSDGKFAFTGSETHLRLWDIASSSVRFEKKYDGKTIRFAAISPDASRLITVLRDDATTAELWDLSSSQRIGKLLHASPIMCARFDGAGSKLIMCELDSDRPFHLWDTKTGAALCKPIGSNFVTESHDVVRSAFGANDQQCVVAMKSGFAIIDSATGDILRTGHLDGNVETDSLAFATNGARIAVLTRNAVDHQRSAVQVFDARTGKLVCSVATGAAWCDISPDSTLLLCGMIEHPAELWDIAKGRKLQSFLGNVSYDAAANWQSNIIAFGVDQNTSIWHMGNPKTGQGAPAKAAEAK